MGRLVDLAQRLTKGTRVLVIGRLDIGHYQSSEGEARVSYDVWADELVSLGPRSDGGGIGSGRRENDQNQPAQTADPTRREKPAAYRCAPNAQGPDDEDLPW
jgi:single-stranded DNA-binding protein